MTRTATRSTPLATAASENYARLLPPTRVGAVGESTLAYAREIRWSERHLQCIWSDALLRPGRLTTTEREPVEVEDPGRWNLEAGPDFLDAVLRVGPERRRLAGDIEVHVRPGDWVQHAHGRDARYARVIAHVTYVPAAEAPAGLPPHCLRIALREALQANPAFTFDDIDLAAYPHAVLPSTPRPCAAALGDDPDRARALLAAAGSYRFEQRRLRLQSRLAAGGADHRQVFYEEFMAALGYKHNQAAFRRLAQALPLAAWPEGRPAEYHYARLLGAAGLLPPADAGRDSAARQFLRTLWDAWWREPVPMPEPAVHWRLEALRPANHPTRRLAAAAALFAAERDPLAAFGRVAGGQSEALCVVIGERLRQLALAHWERRQSLTGPATSRRSVLLGATRVAAICTNVVLPLMAATGHLPNGVPSLPAEDVSAPMRATAAHLLGRDHNPAIYQTDGLLQQGLLQVFHDFCLKAKAGCADCELAQNLALPIT